MIDQYYYELRDGSVSSTLGLDPYLSNGSDTRRVFRHDGPVLKCIHDNDVQPWGYHISIEQSTEIILKAGVPRDTTEYIDWP